MLIDIMAWILTLVILGPIVLGFVFGFTWLTVLAEDDRAWAQWLVYILLALMISITLYLLLSEFEALALLRQLGTAILELLKGILPPYWAQIIVEVSVFLVTVGAGELLFFVRCRRRIFYGRLEQLVAVAFAWFGTTQVFGYDPKNNIALVVLFAELTAIYIYVRGKENIYIAFERGHVPNKTAHAKEMGPVLFRVKITRFPGQAFIRDGPRAPEQIPGYLYTPAEPIVIRYLKLLNAADLNVIGSLTHRSSAAEWGDRCGTVRQTLA